MIVIVDKWKYISLLRLGYVYKMVTKWLGELIRDVFVEKSKAVVKTIP